MYGSQVAFVSSPFIKRNLAKQILRDILRNKLTPFTMDEFTDLTKIFDISTMGDATLDLSEGLVDTLKEAVARKKEKAGPIMPFSMSITNGEIEATEHEALSIDETIKAYEKEIKAREQTPEIVVFVYESFITVNNVQYDCIYFRAHENVASKTYRYAQRFKSGPGEVFVERIGPMTFLGEDKNFLFEMNKGGGNGEKKAWWKLW
jgi:hypothetical protein